MSLVATPKSTTQKVHYSEYIVTPSQPGMWAFLSMSKDKGRKAVKKPKQPKQAIL